MLARSAIGLRSYLAVVLRALSDQHGVLPEVEPCDVLVVAGDVCPTEDHDPEFQARWLQGPFADWLESVPAGEVVGIAGNHDFAFEVEGLVGELPWTYLLDGGATIGALSFWGTPWTVALGPWAFEGEDATDLDARFAAIPAGTDVLVAHTPPRGYGDQVVNWVTRKPGPLVGSESLLTHLERVAPRLCVFGHIHESHGRFSLGVTELANVAILNERYERSHEPEAFEL